MPQAESNLRDRFAPIVFPNDRSELDGMYMTLEVIRYRYKLRRLDNRQKQVLGSIRLPPNLATAYRSNFNNEPLNVAGNFFAKNASKYESDGFSAMVLDIITRQDFEGTAGGAANIALQELQRDLEGGGEVRGQGQAYGAQHLLLSVIETT